ncbi:MAG: zf-HC2 domain-containing protein [Terriglobales bacterium]
MLSNMLNRDQNAASAHLSDQELLRAADGELSPRRADQVQAHLSACWDCRARMAEIEGTIADFARAHRHDLDHQLPPMEGPRALLRAQLAELAAQPPAQSWRRLFQFNSPARSAAAVAAMLLIAVTVGSVLFIRNHSARRASWASAPFERGAEPDPTLTPGATRIVSIGDVCSKPHEEVVSQVSPILRQQVFREYGIANARPDDYEIDYLIAPGLGGVEDLHNLWPEPSTSSTWNAHVKDALEEHLHEMVCAGQLDLSTAQRDIATDWIAAYKKYFHTGAPLSMRSSLVRQGSLPEVDHATNSEPLSTDPE